MKHLIITPVKNEELYIERTIISILKQSIKPDLWIIVNDGSTDNTENIIKKYCDKVSFIKLLNKKDEENTKRGGTKVVNVFNYGLSIANLDEYDIVSKIDSDLEFPENYFLEILDALNKDDKIGVIGGYCQIISNNSILSEPYKSDAVRGPIKTYRKDCFVQIGGLPVTFNWDSIDNLLAKYYGWKVVTLEIPVLHLKPTSTDINNNKKFHINCGIEDYKIGYDLIINLLRSLNAAKANRKILSFILIPLFSAYGYLKSYLKNEEKLYDANFRKFAKKGKYCDILKK